EGADDRNAKFISIIGFFDGKDFHFFEGVLNGQISLEEKGKNGFGYDPIFVPNGKNKTLAEMDISEKNAISHRKNALDKMIDYLRKNILY
ncbi:MAG: non-canonical purine NTP pyrophosphatase, partial [Thermoplasmata archaeon]